MLSFQRLDVYQRAIEFLALVYDIVGQLPKGNADRADQLVRAAESVVRNIAEGAGRWSEADSSALRRRYPPAGRRGRHADENALTVNDSPSLSTLLSPSRSTTTATSKSTTTVAGYQTGCLPRLRAQRLEDVSEPTPGGWARGLRPVQRGRRRRAIPGPGAAP